MKAYKTATAVALLAGLGIATGALPAAAQQQATAACDQDSNGYVSAREARACAERDWSATVGNEESLTRERFDERWAGAEDLDQRWEEADADRDDRVTREEWDCVAGAAVQRGERGRRAGAT